MAKRPPDGTETGAVVIVAVALALYLVLTVGFVCGVCLLGVHALALVAGVLLVASAAAVHGVARLVRAAGGIVLVAAVLGPWGLYLAGVIDHVGGVTMPMGMTIGATVAFLDRMGWGWRVAVLSAGTAGVLGLVWYLQDSRFGFRLHQASLLALAALLVVMVVRRRRERSDPNRPLRSAA